MTKHTISILTATAMLAACGGPEGDLAIAEDNAWGTATPSRTTTNRVGSVTTPTQFVQLQTCTVDFANAFSLAVLPNAAADTFALDPYWIEPCSSGTVIKVESVNYSHFHLSFEDPAIDCYDFDTGGMGRTINGECEGAWPYYLEPRFVQGHTGEHIIKVHVRQNNQAKWFNFDGIRVRDNVPVLVRWRKQNSSTWESTAAYEGFTWFPNTINGVIEVEVRALTPIGPVMSIDDFVIDVPMLP